MFRDDQDRVNFLNTLQHVNNRYKAIVIQKDSHLLEVCRHVVLNPVWAKIVEKPEDYHWSSYLATAGEGKPHPCLTTDWVLGQFIGKRGKAEQEYRKFVQWGIGQKTIWTEVRGQTILGEEGFVDKLVDHMKKRKDILEIPRSQRYAHRPSLDKLFGKEVRLSEGSGAVWLSAARGCLASGSSLLIGQQDHEGRR